MRHDSALAGTRRASATVIPKRPALTGLDPAKGNRGRGNLDGLGRKARRAGYGRPLILRTLLPPEPFDEVIVKTLLQQFDEIVNVSDSLLTLCRRRFTQSWKDVETGMTESFEHGWSGSYSRMT